MAISKMKLVNITGDNEYLNDVLYKFVKLHTIHPEPANKFVDSVHGLTMLPDENPVTEILNYFYDIVNEMGMEVPKKEIVKNTHELEYIKSFIKDVYTHYHEAAVVRAELEKVIQENKDALIQVANIERIDLNLDDVFACKYIKTRFGRLPLDSVEKLQYYRNRPFIFKSFDTDETYSWCVYFTTEKYEGDVDNIFSSLYFERIRIPEFVHGTPDRAKETLQSEIDSDYVQLQHVDEVIRDIKDKYFDELMLIQADLEFLNITFEARKYVVGLGERFAITGFVAEEDVSNLKETFSDLKEVVIEVRPAHSDKRLSPPTKIKNGWFARPFMMFVEMYGIPSYNDFDPTPFVAFTYTLLFGMMFGDLGHGVSLILFSFILYKWKHMQLAEIGIRIGIASSFFGILFGSVFGNETALNPLYKALFGLKEKPIDVMGNKFVLPILGVGVLLGIILIITCIGINIYLKAKHKDIGELLFSQNGVSGLVFYIAFIGGVIAQLVFHTRVFTIPYIALMILLPLCFIFFKEPLSNKIKHKELFPEGVGTYVIETTFELFEILLAFMTNTISYLRVSGFIFSHVGMMLTVSVLVSLTGGAIGFFIAVIGNIFVMLMEGMIVGIQVLRLELYEMFSRYFVGEGITFKTMID